MWLRGARWARFKRNSPGTVYSKKLVEGMAQVVRTMSWHTIAKIFAVLLTLSPYQVLGTKYRPICGSTRWWRKASASLPHPQLFHLNTCWELRCKPCPPTCRDRGEKSCQDTTSSSKHSLQPRGCGFKGPVSFDLCALYRS